MSSIWETFIRKGDGCTFAQQNTYSPYLEECQSVLNQSQSGGENVLINGMYRYEEMLAPIFYRQEQGRANERVRSVLFDILVHYLAQSDIRMEETRESIIVDYIKAELECGNYGKEAQDFFTQLTLKEQNIVGYYYLRQLNSTSSLMLFQKVLQLFYSSARVYRIKQTPKKLLLYIGQEKSEQLEQRLKGLELLFLPIGYRIRYFYMEHFGVIGAEETMQLGNIEVF